MHPYHSEAGRWLASIVLGGRLALFGACVVMLVIWRKSTEAWWKALRARREVADDDQLGAGIWLTALGMVITDAVRVTTTFFHGWYADLPIALALMTLGVLVIVVGYSLHFFAWRAVNHPALKRLSLWWTIAIALIVCAGFWLLFSMTK